MVIIAYFVSRRNQLRYNFVSLEKYLSSLIWLSSLGSPIHLQPKPWDSSYPSRIWCRCEFQVSNSESLRSKYCYRSLMYYSRCHGTPALHMCLGLMLLPDGYDSGFECFQLLSYHNSCTLSAKVLQFWLYLTTWWLTTMDMLGWSEHHRSSPSFRVG